MVTIEALNAVDPAAADAVAVIRAMLDEQSVVDRQVIAKRGHHGIVVSQLNAICDGNDDDRHVFLETVFCIEGGSSKQMTTAQCNVILRWIGEGMAKKWVPLVVYAALKAKGQTELPGLTEQARQETLAGNVGDPDAEMAEIDNQLKGATNVSTPAPPAPEATAHWTADADKFFGWAGRLTLSTAETLESLGADTIEKFTGTKHEAMALVRQYIAEKVEATTTKAANDITPTEREHSESSVVVFTDHIFAPNGLELHATARQGATADDVAAACIALVDGLDMLETLGFTLLPDKVYISPATRAQVQAESPAPAAPPAPTSAPAPSTQALAPAPSQGPPPPSGPPLAGGWTAPIQGPPGPPTQPDGNSDSQYVRVPAVKLSAEVTNNGSPVFKIKGGRMMKTGVTCWPEIAETLAEYLGGWNPVTEMQVGTELDITGCSLIALCEPPAANKKWPGKVVEFVQA